MENKIILKPYEKLLQLVTPILIILLTAHTPNDNDMWWHLSSGNWMLQNKIVLIRDIFSFTKSGEIWVNAFWLGEIFFTIVYKFFGYLGLTISASLIILLTLSFVKKQLQIPFIFIAIPLLVSAFGLSPFSGVRPQLFSFLFLAILDYFLYKYKNNLNTNPIYLIILFALWANFHGGYVWGILLLFAFIAGEVFGRLYNFPGSLSWSKIKTISLFSFFAILTTLINPNGYLIWLLPFRTVEVSISGINEWASPDFHRIDIQPALWFIYILIITVGFSKKKLSFSDMLKIFGFSFMGFVSQRSLAPFLIISAPIIGNSLYQVWTDNKVDTNFSTYNRISKNRYPVLINIFNYAITLILITLSFLQIYNLSSIENISSGYPAEAVKWINKNNLQGNLYNSYNWGGYLIYHLPAHPVFIDGRADLYGDNVIGEWWQIANATNKGIQLLDTWKINLVLLEPNWPIVEKLASSGWKIYYKDNQSIILGRNQ